MSAHEPAPHTPGALDPATYRLAMSRFASGVAVVTSQVRGHDVALTVDSLTSVSLEPVLLLVSLHPEARVLEGLEAGADFAVSVLSAAQRGTAEWLGETGRPLHDQLGRVPHHRGAVSGMAVVDDALACFECRTVDLREAGDHVLALGEVVALEARPTDRPALVHYRGRLGELR
ncbi:flavin reductase family protein [uncultured Serinicoccus sp.]|uniref:flavin reductase family protein n=1 Tax=uncultured Serinicoccus sp. TaxID=735514 RepID=UPI002639F294|nr:flavin reductase family protein [uncultured Serinicoccus sp.]